MPLDAFTAALGETQGRVRRASGEHVFVLGDDSGERLANLSVGDFAEVVQDVDVTDVHLLRVRLRLRAPDDGATWVVSLRLDGVEVAATQGRRGRTREITDLAANVSKVRGVHEFAVRLELVDA